MRPVSRLTTALLGAAALVSGAQAISKISRTGRYLYDSSGDRFYIKGVAYQPQGQVSTSAANTFGEPDTFTDPLADGTSCNRDLPFLQQLGVNTIRVYSVNSSLNHDACMQALSNAGIYTILDLSLPLSSIDRTSPAWSTNLLDTYIQTIEAFQGYDNVLGVNIGNEVVIYANQTGTAAFLKAAARDTKAYLTSISSPILVGYASIDGDPTWRDPLANYLSCDQESTSIDLYGLNNYEWCGNSTFQDSYAGTTGDYAGYNVVAYFSEFGCETGVTRPWTEVAALYNSEMTDVWSGGVAFSYFPASSTAGQFGIVSISSDGSTVTTTDDFNNLKAQYGAVTPPNTPSQSSAGASTYPTCPTQNSTFLASTALPPTPSDSACQCLEKSLSCQFTPATSNQTVVAEIVGELIDEACSLLGQAGGTCNDIAGSGSAGTYGAVQACDAPTKLSFVMSQYYEAQQRNGAACSFAGNGTVNSAAPPSVSAANAAATSCLASATGTSVPSAPPLSSAASTHSSSHSASSTGKSSSSGALPAFADARGLLALVLAGALSVAGGLWTLA